MTTITPRISKSATANSTTRVATSGAVAGTPPLLGTDVWGATWGLPSAWGRTWFFGTAASDGTPAEPAVDVIKRISSAASGGVTKRVTGV